MGLRDLRVVNFVAGLRCISNRFYLNLRVPRDLLALFRQSPCKLREGGVN